mgnify:FL=1
MEDLVIMKKTFLAVVILSASLVTVAAVAADDGSFEIPSRAELSKTLEEASDKDAANQLAQLIRKIENSDQTASEKKQLLAELIKRAINVLGDKAVTVFAALPAEISEESLSPVVAAAVVSAGSGSPAILKEMLKALPDESPAIEIITNAASSPEKILGARIMKQISPRPGSGGQPPASRLGRARPGAINIITVNPAGLPPVGEKYAGQ